MNEAADRRPVRASDRQKSQARRRRDASEPNRTPSLE